MINSHRMILKAYQMSRCFRRKSQLSQLCHTKFTSITKQWAIIIRKISYFPYLWSCKSLGPLDPLASPSLALASNINTSSGELSVLSSAISNIQGSGVGSDDQCLALFKLLSSTWVIHGLSTNHSCLQLESSSHECYNPLALQDFLCHSIACTMHNASKLSGAQFV